MNALLDWIAIVLILICLAGGGGRAIEAFIQAFKIVREHQRQMRKP